MKRYFQPCRTDPIPGKLQDQKQREKKSQVHRRACRHVGARGCTATTSREFPQSNFFFYERPQPSKSRTMTATCARLAASATRFASLRKESVDEDLACRGSGVGDGWAAWKTSGDCRVDERVDEEALVRGDEMGAFMLAEWFLLLQFVS